MKFNSVAAWGFCGGAVALWRAAAFWRESPARATDAYYYATRIRELGETPEILSPLLSILGWLSRTVSIYSPLDGYRLYSLFSYCLFALGIVLVARTLERASSLSTGLTLFLALSSSFIFDAHIAYPRQGLSVGLWMVGVALLRGTFPLHGSAILVAASITHLFGASLAAATILIKMKWSPLIRTLLFGITSVVGIWHLRGKEKFLFGGDSPPGWLLLCGERGCSWAEGIEILILPCLIVGALIVMARHRQAPLLFLTTATGYFLLNVLPWSSEGGTNMRLAWSAPWIGLATLSFGTSYLGRISRPLLVGVGVLGATASVVQLGQDPRRAVPSELAVISHERARLMGWINKTALIQAPRGIEYYVGYELQRSVTWRITSPREAPHREVFELRRVSSHRGDPCPAIQELPEQIPHTVSCINLSNEWKISARFRKRP